MAYLLREWEGPLGIKGVSLEINGLCLVAVDGSLGLGLQAAPSPRIDQEEFATEDIDVLLLLSYAGAPSVGALISGGRFRGRLVATPPTAEITRQLWLEALGVGLDAIGSREVAWTELNAGEWLRLGGGVRVCPDPSGLVLGAAGWDIVFGSLSLRIASLLPCHRCSNPILASSGTWNQIVASVRLRGPLTWRYGVQSGSSGTARNVELEALRAFEKKSLSMSTSTTISPSAVPLAPLAQVALPRVSLVNETPLTKGEERATVLLIPPDPSLSPVNISSSPPLAPMEPAVDGVAAVCRRAIGALSRRTQAGARVNPTTPPCRVVIPCHAAALFPSLDLVMGLDDALRNADIMDVGIIVVSRGARRALSYAGHAVECLGSAVAMSGAGKKHAGTKDEERSPKESGKESVARARSSCYSAQSVVASALSRLRDAQTDIAHQVEKRVSTMLKEERLVFFDEWESFDRVTQEPPPAFEVAVKTALDGERESIERGNIEHGCETRMNEQNKSGARLIRLDRETTQSSGWGRGGKRDGPRQRSGFTSAKVPFGSKRIARTSLSHILPERCIVVVGPRDSAAALSCISRDRHSLAIFVSRPPSPKTMHSSCPSYTAWMRLFDHLDAWHVVASPMFCCPVVSIPCFLPLPQAIDKVGEQAFVAISSGGQREAEGMVHKMNSRMYVGFGQNIHTIIFVFS